MQETPLPVPFKSTLAIFAVVLLVMAIQAAGQETVLHSFGAGHDGKFPQFGSLIADTAGNLFGTTWAGGTNCTSNGGEGCGTVFELSPNGSGGWTETVLYNFCPHTDCADGETPEAGLIFDQHGNLYGTTYYGGTHRLGTVFELYPNEEGGWQEEVLYSFAGDPDGRHPNSTLIFDNNGNLYGTTLGGGTYSDGTVFELSPYQEGGWEGGYSEQVLHSFGSGRDGVGPYPGLEFNEGILYGTTWEGGAYTYGTVFSLSPGQDGTWTETVLHSFAGSPSDGAYPFAPVIFVDGVLYGTTNEGGTHCSSNGAPGCGTVFSLPSTGGDDTVLYNFGATNTDGTNPYGGVIFIDGYLYGTTEFGGNKCCGTVYAVPAGGGGESTLHDFDYEPEDGKYDGSIPWSGLLLLNGTLYGTTTEGGADDKGTVFEVAR